MPHFIIDVQVFDHGYAQEADAERAREAVASFMAKLLPASVAPYFREYVKALNGERCDSRMAKFWEFTLEEADEIARKAATFGWANPSGAHVQLTLSVE